MRSVEELLDELSEQVDQTEVRLDLGHLKMVAKRRRTRRRVTAIAAMSGLVFGVIGLTIALRPSADDPTQISSVDSAPVEDTSVERDGDPDLSTDSTTEDDTALQAQHEIDPEQAGLAMEAVESFLAALAARDYGAAARWWQPISAPDGGPPPATDEAEVEVLVDYCADGCGDGAALIGARGGVGPSNVEGAEVFLQSASAGSTPEPWGGSAGTLRVAPSDPNDELSPWHVLSSPPTSRMVDGRRWIDEVFPAAPPERVVVSRRDGIDIWDGSSIERVRQGPALDPWVRSGWLHTEGEWLNLFDQAQACSYGGLAAEGEPGFLPVDLVRIDGRWMAEMVESNPESAPTELSVFLDCATGSIDRSLDPLASRYYDHGDIDRRLFAPDGSSVLYHANGSGCCVTWGDQVTTADGTVVPLLPEGATSEEQVQAVGQSTIIGLAYSSETDAVAYVVDSGSPGDETRSLAVLVRSLETGALLGSWSVSDYGSLAFDGRYVAYFHSAGVVGPMDGTLHTPAGRILVIDVESGQTVETTTWSAVLHFD